jgi:hypothetical protein
MQTPYHQDKYFYYFRKPAGIASTFGQKKCFISLLLSSIDKDIIDIMFWQQEMFSKQEEY